MSFRLRYILLVVVNSILACVLPFIIAAQGYTDRDLLRIRLIDIRLKNPEDVIMLLVFLSVMLVGLLFDVLLLASKNRGITPEALEQIAASLG